MCNQNSNSNAGNLGNMQGCCCCCCRCPWRNQYPPNPWYPTNPAYPIYPQWWGGTTVTNTTGTANPSGNFTGGNIGV